MSCAAKEVHTSHISKAFHKKNGRRSGYKCMEGGSTLMGGHLHPHPLTSYNM